MKRPFCSPSCSSVIEASYKSGNCDGAGARVDSCLNPIPAHAKARKRAKRDAMPSRIVRFPGAFDAGRASPLSFCGRVKGISARSLSTSVICSFVCVGLGIDSRNNNNSKLPRKTAAKEGMVWSCE